MVIDASAGVELLAETSRGRALRALLPPLTPVPWAVLRRWDLNAILRAGQISEALRQLATWPRRVALSTSMPSC